MLAKIERFLARKPAQPEFTPEDHDRHYELKRQWLEALLGPMHKNGIWRPDLDEIARLNGLASFLVPWYRAGLA
jgi:hypothetical protein